MPTSSEATSAPTMLPMPPITTTTKASMITCTCSPGFTATSGAASAPPSPASAVPSANTPVNSALVLVPSALSMLRSIVAARTRMPQRVRCSSAHNASAIAAPNTMRNMR